MVTWLRKAAAGLAALAVLTGAATAQVPDPYARELAGRLSYMTTRLSENGYARAAGPFAGGVRQQGSQRFTVMLRAGQDYRIVAVCDSRCSDVNLRLFTADNQLIAQDMMSDAAPIIHVRPTATGDYDIEAVMARCTGDPCWFAFNVYSR